MWDEEFEADDADFGGDELDELDMDSVEMARGRYGRWSTRNG